MASRNLKALFICAGLFAATTLVCLDSNSVFAKAKKSVALPTHPVDVTVRRISSFHRSGVTSRLPSGVRFVGGLVLRSTWEGFGGLSDLTMSRDGKTFLAVSDEGRWLRGSLGYDGLAPVSVSDVRWGEFQALSGRVLGGKRERDAEGIDLASGSLAKGSLLISFERIHRIGRFKIDKNGIVGPSAYLKLPEEARSLWQNKGLESIGVLRGGQYKGAIVAIAERARGATNGEKRPGWILSKGKARKFFVKDKGDMDITSLAGLANGDVLILERRFRWSEGIKMRIRRIRAKDLRAGAVVDGDVLLEVGFDHEIDNMEGLSVHSGPNGETILTLISDDNFNKLLQRTLLLQFELIDAPMKVRAKN